jgi:hypothetical protein
MNMAHSATERETLAHVGWKRNAPEMELEAEVGRGNVELC